MSERDGRLTVDGDRAVLNFERRLPFPVEVVWSAITDPHEREQWFGETTIEAHEGGTIEMVATGPPLPPERKQMTGRILVWDPPHVLEHEWKQPIVEDGVVRYELTADGNGTLLRFTHRGLGVRNASGFFGGTHAYLDRLEAYLTGDELPDWTTRRLEEDEDVVDAIGGADREALLRERRGDVLVFLSGEREIRDTAAGARRAAATRTSRSCRSYARLSDAGSNGCGKPHRSRGWCSRPMWPRRR